VNSGTYWGRNPSGDGLRWHAASENDICVISVPQARGHLVLVMISAPSRIRTCARGSGEHCSAGLRPGKAFLLPKSRGAPGVHTRVWYLSVNWQGGSVPRRRRPAPPLGEPAVSRPLGQIQCKRLSDHEECTVYEGLTSG
jgi:hypothetical protein